MSFNSLIQPEPDVMLSLYALTFCGVPYRYGGTNPLQGLDCSALVRILLHSQAVHTSSPGNALDLFAQFSKSESHISTVPQLGALVFYQDSTGTVDHVAMCLNQYQHIESAGGDHTVVTFQDAVARNAFVRVTPIRHDGRAGIFMPDYPWAGTP